MSSRDYRRRDRSWEKEDRDRDRDRPRHRRSSRSRSPRRGDRDRREYGRDQDRDRRDKRYDDRRDRDDRRSDRRDREREPPRRGDREDRHSERPRDSTPTERREPGSSKTAPGPASSSKARPNLGNDTPDATKTPEENGEAQMDGVEGDDEAQMMAMMGLTGFGSTKGAHVEGNQEGAVNVKKLRTWRQYMNRRGGFNRPLDKIK